MNEFNVLLHIEDCFVDECSCKRILDREICVRNSSQTATLFDSFLLNIVRVTPTFFTVLIQNGIQVIIRNVYTNYTETIPLPNECGCGRHMLCLSGTVIEA